VLWLRVNLVQLLRLTWEVRVSERQPPTQPPMRGSGQAGYYPPSGYNLTRELYSFMTASGRDKIRYSHAGSQLYRL